MFRMQRRTSLFLLLAGLLVISTACYRPLSSPNTITDTPQLVDKHLSAFHPIEGTDYLIATISGDLADSGRESLSPFNWAERGYSGYSGYEVYNYVFFGAETETFNKLVPTNEYIVQQIVGFPSSTPTEHPEDFQPVRWWLYVLIKEDTDQNQILDAQDKMTIGVTDVGGNAPTDVIAEVDAVLGHTLADDQNTLFVFYRSLDKNYVAKIDLPGRQVMNTNEINLGNDVK